MTQTNSSNNFYQESKTPHFPPVIPFDKIKHNKIIRAIQSPHCRSSSWQLKTISRKVDKDPPAKRRLLCTHKSSPLIHSKKTTITEAEPIKHTIDRSINQSAKAVIFHLFIFILILSIYIYTLSAHHLCLRLGLSIKAPS